jgi:hypothetical protein
MISNLDGKLAGNYVLIFPTLVLIYKIVTLRVVFLFLMQTPVKKINYEYKNVNFFLKILKARNEGIEKYE